MSHWPMFGTHRFHIFCNLYNVVQIFKTSIGKQRVGSHVLIEDIEQYSVAVLFGYLSHKYIFW